MIGQKAEGFSYREQQRAEGKSFADVHIRWLREKLELDPSKPEYVITVRGFGYRFG